MGLLQKLLQVPFRVVVSKVGLAGFEPATSWSRKYRSTISGAETLQDCEHGIVTGSGRHQV